MKISTDYNSGNYSIEVARGMLKDSITAYTGGYSQVHYLIDEKVFELHKGRMLAFIDHPILMGSGETSKSFEAFHYLLETLLAKGVKRNDLIVVIGGGAAGDAGGFAASCVLRGLDYIHVPTTLLAHDSSIGGKTAINSKHGKNLIGAFYRPAGVIYDLEFLNTLPDSEILSGFGEVIKHAMLKNQETVDHLVALTRNGIDLRRIEPFVISGIETKMQYVNRDENESDIRKYLNLGHTLGHAVEYKYKIPHGIAVVIGIYAALHISNQVEQYEIFDLSYYYCFFDNLGYPMDILKDIDAEEMLSLISKDKKNQNTQTAGYVILKEFGEAKFIEIEKETLGKYINDIKESI
ncbi:3-dehydroquinate synthase [Salinicoccus albus]|uniref:3-dehydroquinate synthase n=1 Tax=Salinicoccus albus TaxID=418756 RepID=UPI0003A6EC55|nr:3-dehydroquinate synthase family protein [Salinicoccus albus]